MYSGLNSLYFIKSKKSTCKFNDSSIILACSISSGPLALVWRQLSALRQALSERAQTDYIRILDVIILILDFSVRSRVHFPHSPRSGAQ